jgi:hypothetical protein
MLPGLDSNRTTFPSLHLFLQQKYHKDNNALAAAFEDDGSNLHYFDCFIVWIAPIQLDVDEEFLVRCFRYFQAVWSLFSLSENFSHSNKLFSNEDFLPLILHQEYCNFLELNKRPYKNFKLVLQHKASIYFCFLQLHPIDIVVSFRPSPDLTISNLEMAFISVISQLNSARLCLNALVAENAFGSFRMMTDILSKHYRASFWRQFHKLIGSTDIVEGSVGLVANLGTGVYDLFYEPIEGLLGDSNGSFFNGLSKGAVSLSSRAIGGTSALTSKIVGGLGKGVSMLTLDSQFQRSRNYRRYNKSSTISEGLIVGTKELGKNIVEGVTGIVVSPYKGWETGGGVGFGMGIAKGILVKTIFSRLNQPFFYNYFNQGVALKPAVGVFDLASRATEGIRNTAFNNANCGDISDDRDGIHRYRIPRSFGRNNSLFIYDINAAAAQYLADCLTFFKTEPRLNVVYHQHINRKIVRSKASDSLFLHNRFISGNSKSDILPEEVNCSTNSLSINRNFG